MVTEAAKVVKTFTISVGRNTVKVVGRAVKFLAADTPRDTAFAASNWIASIGIPHSGTVGSKSAVSFSFQLASINSLRRYVPGRGKIFIVNNVAYIGLLDSGSSSQSPSGFVNSSLRRAVASVR